MQKIKTLLGKAGLAVMMPMVMQGLDADDDAVRRKLVAKRDTYLARRFWNIYGRGLLAATYQTTDDDCAEVMERVRAKVEDILHPFLDDAGDR